MDRFWKLVFGLIVFLVALPMILGIVAVLLPVFFRSVHTVGGIHEPFFYTEPFVRTVGAPMAPSSWLFGLSGASLVLLLAVGLVAVFAAFLARGRGRDDEKRLSGAEARIMQEIHRGLQDMERRVEALETILLDRERTPHRVSHDS